MGNHLQAESYTKPEKGKQGGLVVPIHLPTKPHTHHPVTNGGVFGVRREIPLTGATSRIQELSAFGWGT